MFKIDKSTKQIDVTRGDYAPLQISANNDGTPYIFQIGDVVRLKVFKAKDCSNIELIKEVTVEEETTLVRMDLSGEDTKIGDLINKPVEYWYEVELNPETKPQTIIGYDQEGEKIFMLYPEGDDN